MTRTLQFVRSILPEDPFQLFLLAGLVCLSIAPHLRWWPTGQNDQWSATLRGSPVWMEYYVLQVAAFYGLILASSVGYFLCWWPGKRQVAKVWLGVLCPAFVSVVVIAAKFLSIRAGGYSVLSQTHRMNMSFSWSLRELWLVGSGMHFAIAGIALTAIFAGRLMSGLSRLPLVLASPFPIGDTQDERAGSKRLIWFSVAPISMVIMAAVGVGLLGPLMSGSAYKNPRTWMFLQDFVGAAVILVVTMWLTGNDNRNSIYQLLRRVPLKMVFVGASLPALVTIGPLMAWYLFDRVHWAAHDFGKYSPPSPTNYLPTPEVWTLGLVFGAFAEEVIFRGVLQRYFVGRYGVWRGIFLVGVVWGAFHFFSDKYQVSSDQEIVFGLLYRVVQCSVLGFALSWLTLRSGSLFPATLAHWLSNVGVYSVHRLDFPGKEWIRTFLWLLVVLVLFRFWPIASDKPNENAKTSVSPEFAGA